MKLISNEEVELLRKMKAGDRPHTVPNRFMELRWVRPIAWVTPDNQHHIGFELDNKGESVLEMLETEG